MLHCGKGTIAKAASAEVWGLVIFRNVAYLSYCGVFGQWSAVFVCIVLARMGGGGLKTN